MTESQRDKVLAMAPARLKRTFTLREAARLGSLADAGTVEDLAAARPRFRATEPEDVMDPMGKEETCFTRSDSRSPISSARCPADFASVSVERGHRGQLRSRIVRIGAVAVLLRYAPPRTRYGEI